MKYVATCKYEKYLIADKSSAFSKWNTISQHITIDTHTILMIDKRFIFFLFSN